MGRKTGKKRQKEDDESADVTYINKANKHFNKKIARYFDKYTKEWVEIEVALTAGFARISSAARRYEHVSYTSIALGGVGAHTDLGSSFKSGVLAITRKAWCTD